MRKEVHDDIESLRGEVRDGTTATVRMQAEHTAYQQRVAAVELTQKRDSRRITRLESVRWWATKIAVAIAAGFTVGGGILAKCMGWIGTGGGK